MAPRTVPCEMCGQMFFPASLKFHQKACKEKMAKAIVECPYCSVETIQGELDAHLKTCRAALDAASLAGRDDQESAVLPDGRIRCVYCGRGFLADRIHKHAQICGNLKQARPKAPDGTITQSPPSPTRAEKVVFERSASVSRAERPREPPASTERAERAATAAPRTPVSCQGSPGLLPGSRVRLQKLRAAAHLNGVEATLIDLDADAGCWLVRLEGGPLPGAMKPLKAENMASVNGSSYVAPARSRPDSPRAARSQPDSPRLESRGERAGPRARNGLRSESKAKARRALSQDSIHLSGTATTSAASPVVPPSRQSVGALSPPHTSRIHPCRNSSWLPSAPAVATAVAHGSHCFTWSNMAPTAVPAGTVITAKAWPPPTAGGYVVRQNRESHGHS
eukprot:TRINITY_DN34387_c0_g1_i1.p1 TRINITY_DN34387_c0_g1~~TRINITY_DN34387_c0_g1_i1.p1  ORF type:complete len:408 (+),score=52.59 TRINITY_DN34387_c0_g1_i1:44-1225(+)